jgi:outer membrane protein, protease secretion system
VRRWLVLALLASAAGGVFAQGLSLAAAFDAARTYDPKYQAALREFDASREYRIQGRAALGPEVGLSASLAKNLLDQSLGGVSRNLNYPSNDVAVQLRQPIYNAELRARSREGEARSRQGETC